MVGCHRSTAPQSPSRRNGEVTQVDTALLAMMTYNERMAEAADNELIKHIEQQELSFAQTEIGTWVSQKKKNNIGDTPQKDERWVIRLIIKDLDGNLIEDTEQTYTIGHNELPVAVTNALSEMHHGEEVLVLAPWYTAFGQQGKKGVPPYTNVQIEVIAR